MLLRTSALLVLAATVAQCAPASLPTSTTIVVAGPTVTAPSATVAVPPASSPTPTMTLDYGTFVGFNKNGVNNFLGVPFVKPPVGDLRFRLPVLPPNKFATIQNATLYGPSCHQLGANQNENAAFAALPPALAQMIGGYTAGQVLTAGESEDCLTINIKVPSGPVPAGGFPILVWIFGGGFTNGGTASYEGQPIVERSIALGTPVIYVSMNYRLNGFGFFNSKELSAAGVGNLGLQDQRAGLLWVNRYAAKFSGNPNLVTIWGESAGAISVGHQLLANNGNAAGAGNLFRGAFTNSGTQIAVGDYKPSQIYFDNAAKAVGCYGKANVLACLRLVPYATLRDAIDLTPGIFTYQSLHEAFLPRFDGTFLSAPSQQLVAQGKYAKIPVVTGDCDDEGTLFSAVAQVNVTTDAEVSSVLTPNAAEMSSLLGNFLIQGAAYLQQFFFPNATVAEANAVFALYPSDPAQGSPYDTGSLNQLTPQFKRISSFQGDFAFQAPRRYFLNAASKTQAVWSFLYKRTKDTPFLGSFHGTDIVEGIYAPGSGSLLGDFQLMDYLINFVVYLDPNGNGKATNLLSWPKWDNTLGSPSLLTFVDGVQTAAGVLGLTLISDTYRAAQMNFLQFLGIKYPL